MDKHMRTTGVGTRLGTWVLQTLQRPRDERGDVPGWVMVTVMTAAVVALLMPVVGSSLKELLEGAFESVGAAVAS